MDTKELVGGVYEDGRKRESRSDVEESGTASWVRVWMRERAESEQPALGSRSQSAPLWDPGARRPEWLQQTLALARLLRPLSLIGRTHRAWARGAAVDEVLPPSGLVADMVVGVCLESVHYHECQHACFNQEPSSIPNTALLNGKTFQHLNYGCAWIYGACLDFYFMPWLDLAVGIFPWLRLVIYNTYVAKWQIDNLDNERQCLIALSWQPDRAALYRDIKLNVIAFFTILHNYI